MIYTSQRHDGYMADCQLGAATRTGCADRCAHECRSGIERGEIGDDRQHVLLFEV